MRLFVAINLNNEMKDALVALQNELYDQGVRGNFTADENMHLTLAFIGEHPDAEPILHELHKVSFTAEGAGCFGDLWWVGLDESAQLEAVVRRVRRALAQNDIPFDRKRFSPHITLIRRARGRLPELQAEPVTMTVNAISLIRSDRGRNGMIYTELGTVEGI